MISSAASRARQAATAVLAPASARRWAGDAAIAAVVTALALAGGYASASWHAGHHAPPGVLAYLLLAAGGLSLIFRRGYPAAVLAFTLAAAVGAQAAGAQFVWLAVIVAFFSAVLAGRRAAAVAALAAGYLVSVLSPVLTGSGHVSVTFALGLLAWLLVLLSAAELWRARRQRAIDLERGRQEELARRAMAERVAIARDLHDVVAHSISVINVQANTALHLIDRQPEHAREALTAIHDVSRQALGEIRSVLGVLRADGEAAPRDPGPGIERLIELAARAQSAGICVDLSEEGTPRSVPAEVSVAAYRIVQEALTNTARHSGGAKATVRLRYDDDVLAVEVRDDGSAVISPFSGNGITGMTERAEALGGTLLAGPDPAGGYRVLARLPIAAGAR